MSITGNLKTMELAELLQWLSQGTKTGTLTIDSGTVEKRIFFDKGKIVSSASTDPKEHLGHFLVSHGYIDELTLAKVIDMQKSSGMLLGKILMTVGAISENDLNKMLRLKAEESIYEIFRWKEGDFSFADSELPSQPMVPLTLEVPAIVFEGARRLDEWRRIRERIPTTDLIVVSMGELVADEKKQGGQTILDAVNDDRTIAEIAIETHASEFYTCRVLFDQLRAGKLKLIRPRGGSPAKKAAKDVGDIGSATLVRTAILHLKAGEYNRALRHLEAARALEPDNSQIQAEISTLEQAIDAKLTSAGISLEAIPKLTRPAQDIVELDITPEQGFILSRIDGSYPIETILKISPMPDLRARVVFWSLLKAGHISV